MLKRLFIPLALAALLIGGMNAQEKTIKLFPAGAPGEKAPLVEKHDTTGSKVGGEIEGLPDSTILPLGVHWHGFLDDTPYAHLFAHAGALIFPSLYEGFGIPVLEALHLRVPVACSRIASLPEVGGDLVRYFDPFSPEDIAEKMIQLETGGHAEHSSGDDLGKRFDWDENVARLKQALARPPQRQ